jgi:hypothetical protein
LNKKEYKRKMEGMRKSVDHGQTGIVTPQKPGYIFTGFWNGPRLSPG